MPPLNTRTAYPDFGLPYWLDFDRPRFTPLDHDATTDVAIVGAGIAGLKLARCLAQLGVRCIVLEGSIVGDGASGRNQGSMNHGAGVAYGECVAKWGRTNARELYQMGLENQRLAYEQVCEYQINCSWEVLGFTFWVRRDAPGWEKSVVEYRRDADLLTADGFQARFMSEADLRADGQHPLWAAGLHYPSDSQFHSGRYVAGIAAGVARSPLVKIHDQTRVSTIEPDGPNAVRLTTPRGAVRAQRVFLLTNALVPQFVPSLGSAVRGERGQVLVTEPLAQVPCRGSYGGYMAWWREIPEPDGRYRLLFGGGRKRDEPDSVFMYDHSGPQDADPMFIESEGFKHTDAHQQRLDEQFRLIFPHLGTARITHRWGGLQAFTADSLPMIGEFDPARRIHGMAGFCGRGNAHSDVGAQYLAGKVAGVVTPVEQRFGRFVSELLTPGRKSAKW